MKRVALACLIMLLGIASVYADSYYEDAVQDSVKGRQLEQLAKKFKAETGFRGEINYDYARMKLQSFEGKFADIPYSADADTSAFRQACETILDKLMPYSLAKHSQMSMNKINKQGNYTRTDYYQQVNGYRVESGGFIVITYDAGRHRFDIGDNSVELPEVDISNIITANVAELIALKTVNSARHRQAEVLRTVYSNVSSDKYYLAHIVSVHDSDALVPILNDFIVWINAITGEVMQKSKVDYIE